MILRLCKPMLDLRKWMESIERHTCLAVVKLKYWVLCWSTRYSSSHSGWVMMDVWRLFTKFIPKKLQISVNHNNPCRLQRKQTLVMFSDQNASMAVLCAGVFSLCFTLQWNGFFPLSLPTSVFHSSPLTSPPHPPHCPTSCFLIQCNSVSALVSLPLPSLYLSPLCCHLVWQAYSQSNESKSTPPPLLHLLYTMLSLLCECVSAVMWRSVCPLSYFQW